jgi:hypothetical protein
VVPFAAIPVFSRVFDMPSAHLLLLPSTFLCIGTYMYGTLTTPFVVSLAVGRPDISARQNIVALFVVVPASAIAIYWFGLNGAGFSWVIYHLFAYSYGLPRICRECLGIAPRVWYSQIARILALTAPTYGTAWAIVHAYGNFSVLWLSVAYLAGSVAYVAGAYVMMGQELRESLLQPFRAVRLKMAQNSWS